MAFVNRSFSRVLNHVQRQLNHRIGLDVGSATIRLWSDQGEVELVEPACLAIEKRSQRVVAVGREAAEMQGRVGDEIKICFPWRKGVMQDMELAEAMLRIFFQRVFRATLFFRPVLLVSVPGVIGEPEKTMLVEVLFRCGVREVNFIDQVLAATIGAGVPVADASGTVVVQLGAGVTEVGVVSLGAIVHQHAVVGASEELEEELRRILRAQLGLSIGQRTLDQLKQQVLSFSTTTPRHLRISGQEVLHDAPQEVEVESTIFLPALQRYAHDTLQLIREVLAQVPPELASDVIDKGILLSGGLSNIPGWSGYLTAALGVPVAVAEQPELTVLRGVEQAARHLELFQQSFGYRHDVAYNA